MSRNRAKLNPSPWRNRFRVAGRVALLLGLILVVAWIVSHLIFSAVKPFIRGNQLASNNSVLDRQLKARRESNTKLEKQIAWINSPEGVIDRARHSGMAKPGEERVSVQIDHPKPVTAPHDPSAAASATTEATLLAVSLFALAFFIGLAILWHRRRLTAARPVGMLTPRSELSRRKRPAH